MNIDLEAAGLVDGGIQKSEKTLEGISSQRKEKCGKIPHLVSNVRPRLADITIHLAHDADVLVAVEQRVFLILGAGAPAMSRPVGLQAGVGENDNQTLGI